MLTLFSTCCLESIISWFIQHLKAHVFESTSFIILLKWLFYFYWFHAKISLNICSLMSFLKTVGMICWVSCLHQSKSYLESIQQPKMLMTTMSDLIHTDPTMSDLHLYLLLYQEDFSNHYQTINWSDDRVLLTIFISYFHKSFNNDYYGCVFVLTSLLTMLGRFIWSTELGSA